MKISSNLEWKGIKSQEELKSNSTNRYALKFDLISRTGNGSIEGSRLKIKKYLRSRQQRLSHRQSLSSYRLFVCLSVLFCFFLKSFGNSSFSFPVVHQASHATSSSIRDKRKRWLRKRNEQIQTELLSLYFWTEQMPRTRQRVLCWYSFVSQKRRNCAFVKNDMGQCHYFRKDRHFTKSRSIRNKAYRVFRPILYIFHAISRNRLVQSCQNVNRSSNAFKGFLGNHTVQTFKWIIAGLAKAKV